MWAAAGNSARHCRSYYGQAPAAPGRGSRTMPSRVFCEKDPMRHTLLTCTLTAAALAALALPAAAQQSTLGRNLAATCANCHGTNGAARGEMKPLAGVSAAKIVAAMNDFRSGNMPATIMHQIAKGYTEAQVEQIAAYFAAQKPAAK